MSKKKLLLLTTGEYSDFEVTKILRVPEGRDPKDDLGRLETLCGKVPLGKEGEVHVARLRESLVLPPGHFYPECVAKEYLASLGYETTCYIEANYGWHDFIASWREPLEE